jgi:hypothetical protein
LRRIAVAALAVLTGCSSAGKAERVERVSPVWVHEQLGSATPPVFACAYEAKECQGTHPQGCMTLEDLRSRLPAMPKDRVLVLCCG